MSLIIKAERFMGEKNTHYLSKLYEEQTTDALVIKKIEIWKVKQIVGFY